MQHRRHAGCHQLAGPGEVALDVEVRFARLGAFRHDQRRDHPGATILQITQTRILRLEFLVVATQRKVNDSPLLEVAFARRLLERFLHRLAQTADAVRRQLARFLRDSFRRAVQLPGQIVGQCGLLGIKRDVVQLGVGQFERGLILIVEDGEHSEILLVRNRIELVVVALRAGDGQPEERRAGGRQPVHDRLDAELLLVDAALLVDLRIAMKAGGDRGVRVLGDGVSGQHVPSDLFDDKLIERQVAVQRVDHPVAVQPDRARRVDAVAVRIRVTRHVQPPTRPAFTVVRRIEQPCDEPVVRARRRVVHEGVHLGDRGRQAGQVQRGAANQRVTIRLGRWRETFLFQPGKDKGVDRIADLRAGSRDGGQRRARGLLE